jgi:hypothetical protein
MTVSGFLKKEEKGRLAGVPVTTRELHQLPALLMYPRE